VLTEVAHVLTWVDFQWYFWHTYGSPLLGTTLTDRGGTTWWHGGATAPPTLFFYKFFIYIYIFFKIIFIYYLY